MSVRLSALAALAATLLAACGEFSSPTTPLIEQPKPALVIDAAAVCDGSTMPVSECGALVTLYNSAGGAGWLFITDWGTDPNPCSWTGVTCSQGATGSVQKLDLTAKNLTGTIPPELGNLVSIEELRLGFNNLSGTLPAVLGNLPGLKILDVDSNQLTGPVPASLGSNQSFEKLWIARNHFSGTIPPELANLTNLTVLDLDANSLTGTIPAQLGNLTNVEYLGLSRNEFTGSIPAELGSITALAYFALHGNQLSGLIPLAVAQRGGAISCTFADNDELYLPDAPEYRAADIDGDGMICQVGFTPADDIGEDAVEDIDELVPATLNEGQANALKTKIENAMAKAAAGQYGAAINQLQAFLSQLNNMVADGTLTPAQAQPFIDQATSLIAIWTGML